MTHLNLKRVLSLGIVLALLVCLFCGGAVSASAAEQDFTTSSVLEDLLSSSQNGKPFRLTDYPYNPFGCLQIIAFVEYGYAYDAAKRDDYGLYLYVYNPQQLPIVTTSEKNKVQMAVSYDANGEPLRYEKFQLQFVSKSHDGDSLFYKFKIQDRLVDGTYFADRVNVIQRRYDISGVELLVSGNINATDYPVGGCYKFRGYASGLGFDPSGESTLAGTVDEFQTLSLNVQHTNYRTDQYTPNHYYNIDSVYFSVPKSILDRYGELQRIHAEWWEYKTAMMAVTSNEEFYKTLDAYKTAYAWPTNEDIPYSMYAEYNAVGTGPVTHDYGWVFNKYTESNIYNIYSYNQRSAMMPLVFYSPYSDTKSIFDFLCSKVKVGDVDASAVEAAFKNYPIQDPVADNVHPSYFTKVNGRWVFQNLLSSPVDEGRTQGYNDVTVDLSDAFDLQGYQGSWWDKFLDYGWTWPSTHETLSGVSRFVEVESSDLVGDDAAVAKALLVNVEDVPALRQYYKSVSSTSRVFLYRFADTDYYTAPAFRTGYSGTIDNTDTYIAQMTVFFDFDVIDLTFNGDGVYTVIPAVSDPIDIINDIDNPDDETFIGVDVDKLEDTFSILKKIVSVILLVFLVLLVLYLIQFVGNFLSSRSNGSSGKKSQRPRKKRRR